LAVENTGSGNSFIVGDEANDTSPFVIDASGNVGIGTAAPNSKLHVEGDGARLVLKTSTQDSGSRNIIAFENNEIGTFEGDDHADQKFDFHPHNDYGLATANAMAAVAAGAGAVQQMFTGSKEILNQEGGDGTEPNEETPVKGGIGTAGSNYETFRLFRD